MLQYLSLAIDAAANIVWIKIGVISSPSLNLRWDLRQIFLQPLVNLSMWTENMWTMFWEHVKSTMCEVCEPFVMFIIHHVG